MSKNFWQGKTLGIIGGGNMAEALVRGVILAGLISEGKIAVYDVLPQRRQVFRSMGCRAADTPEAIVGADVILLATKPQNLDEALANLATRIQPHALVISIAAGIPTSRIERILPPGGKVVRVMPNTPLLVGQGMSALARGASATSLDMDLALALFACAGEAVEVNESVLDSVTALSGSGPAYLFLLAEALIAGGIALGLTPSLAKQLTIGMLRGSAEMLSQFQEPGLLRERVTSPGGTTAAALQVFNDGNLAGLVADALSAAKQRSIELGKTE